MKKVEVFISEYPTIETVVPLKGDEDIEQMNQSWDELIAKWKQIWNKDLKQGKIKTDDWTAEEIDSDF